MFVLSTILHAIYLFLPAGSLGVFATKNRATLKRSIAGAWISGTILAGAILGAYVAGIGGTVSFTQIGKAIYVAVGLMLFLKLIDHLFKSLVFRLFRINQPDISRWRVVGAVATRVIIFSTFALPWVMSAVMVYRPRVVPVETPESILRIDYQQVELKSRDGIDLAGWYIPATTHSAITAIVCHGLGANKASMWAILRSLHDAEINVLTIDLRAHAESGGQLTTFGATESNDVIGAIDWLRDQHAESSTRIAAIGASLGGAAILSAAAQDQRIDAVVTIGTFDSLPQLAKDLSDQHIVPPINYLTRWLALPMASLHAGANLSAVRPGDQIDKIWPRPVMIVHGANDEIIPFSHGKNLYEKAFSPRISVFTGGTHNGIMDDPQVIEKIIEFVLQARPVPVI